MDNLRVIAREAGAISPVFTKKKLYELNKTLRITQSNYKSKLIRGNTYSFIVSIVEKILQ